MSGARFIITEQAIINIDDISTVVPVATREAGKFDGVKITFMSKGTSLTIEGTTVSDIAKHVELAAQFAP